MQKTDNRLTTSLQNLKSNYTNIYNVYVHFIVERPLLTKILILYLYVMRY